MSALNVLDAIDAECRRWGGHPNANRLAEARAAVAELIGAHRRLLDYVLSEAEAREYNPPADTKIIADSMAALARVRGEA